ncbi:MAG TPA: YhcH/YjgK/YiaL family protein [Vibrio sp.]|uniref:YhcH/YjgK/YiaL family protein n=1 Tax=Vibrio TaxID=662 RepID=UPI0003F9D878|nr:MULTISPECIES: YhcH/YjgK/YiaL family protein [Vibrio]HCH02776.1 YhcH/YjgK/YiaL family protein [Vibrio sp.]
MICGSLFSLQTAGLPASFKKILSLPQCTFEALVSAGDQKLQLADEVWFCNIGPASTQESELRHTEFHKLYADIQVVLEGEEIINYGVLNCMAEEATEKKADLLILSQPNLTQSVHLKAGDFAIFLPGEPHQALCMVTEPQSVRKAVFKVPLSMIKERL